MHQIGEVSRAILEGRTFEVEKNIHHKGRKYSDCERDCPKGWQIITYWLLQGIRNNSSLIKEFNLLDTYEYIQNPDSLSKEKGFVAWFYANSNGPLMYFNKVPSFRDSSLGVRYVREISK
ncbi:MAG: hypothetical protein AABX23_00050 [Nanoarchaeota archaeon]|mgnify:CR=1 FL=1